MSKKPKYYVVWEGHNPGIYNSWGACKAEIETYPGAKYKSFKTKAEAEYAFEIGHEAVWGKGKKKKSSQNTGISNASIVTPSISVDGACSGNPGLTEYQGVYTDSKVPLFHGGPYEGGSNNLGEFLALVHAISWLKREGADNMPIYTDSRTAMAWIRNKKVKTTIKRSHINSVIFKLVDRAENWIKNNHWQNPILKWDTKNWGEIPADFGRK